MSLRTLFLVFGDQLDDSVQIDRLAVLGGF